MEYRPLNLTLISAEGLKDVNLFGKMDVYAEVSIAGYPQSKKKTPVDKNCGPNPKWNHKMEFIVDEPYLTKPGLNLFIQLKAEGTIGSDKEVGSATVPVHDLYKPDSNEDRVVEYQIRTPSGKSKGSIKFSCRFGEKFTHQVEEKKHVASEPVTAYPAAPAPYAGGSGYPPAPYAGGSGYPPGSHPGMAYQHHPPPPAGYGGYPQPSGYGYQQPPPPGYGYPPPGYAPGYGQYAQAPQKPKKNKMGMGGGLGLGLGAGLLGGLLVGEMASDIGDAASYADGYDDAMGDMGGGFDF
ncbi:hypothetical protein DH2020_003264 [Rehmannia glutinosa]|uniref:C2 domain-containing protein n=1 Tax=Rehmannia glutinosa TaxID=99300 RepID=A0ABR0XLK0_REHGL